MLNEVSVLKDSLAKIITKISLHHPNNDTNGIDNGGVCGVFFVGSEVEFQGITSEFFTHKNPFLHPRYTYFIFEKWVFIHPCF